MQHYFNSKYGLNQHSLIVLYVAHSHYKVVMDILYRIMYYIYGQGNAVMPLTLKYFLLCLKEQDMLYKTVKGNTVSVFKNMSADIFSTSLG